MISDELNINAPCICCGEKAWQMRHKLPQFIFGDTVQIFSCKCCGLGKTAPPPSVELDFYEENEKYDSLFIGKENLYKKFATYLLGMLKHNEDVIKGKRLLDVGCGGGFLVQSANEMGFKASGIDANAGMVRWASERGIPVEQGDIQQKISKASKYDVIVLSAVLEHLSDPSGLLIDCKKLLSPGGVILVSQASYDGLLPRIFPWGWYGWQPQEHYWHFTPNSFSKLAMSCGLNMSRCRRNSLYHQFYTSGGVKVLIGRNLATFIALVGNLIGMGDNFDCILIAEGE